VPENRAAAAGRLSEGELAFALLYTMAFLTIFANVEDGWREM
jgi:hypothetical protein